MGIEARSSKRNALKSLNIKVAGLATCRGVPLVNLGLEAWKRRNLPLPPERIVPLDSGSQHPRAAS